MNQNDNVKKKKYEPPTLTKVVLNPNQALLSVCSTVAGVNTALAAGGTFCRDNPAPQICRKSGAAGDSAGHS